ncbi:hypothetical protein [uncultured Bartonella sp.]|uniref:hypothetical protein n=1 Tax=uncultured Bartonella sp. TaxID=104108 RepID=UPI002623ED5E|nr:hypothetical protein [uncultured Bartonella sp.]
MSEDSAQKAKTNPLWKKIVAGLILIAIICGGFIFYLAHSAQQHVENFLKANGVSYSSLEVNWRRHFTVHDAIVKFSKDNPVTIATIKGEVSFSGKTSKKLDLENITYHIGKNDISVPLLVLHDYTIAKKTARENDDDRIDFKDIAFKKAVMPTVLIKRKTSREERNVTYTNVAYDDLQKGIVKKITIDGLLLNHENFGKNGVSAKDQLTTATTGKIIVDKFNVRHLLSYYTEQSSTTDESNPFIDFMSAWSVQDIVFDTANGTKNSGHMTIDKLSGSKLSARLLPFLLTDFIDEIDNSDLDNASNPALLSQLKAKEFDILASFGAANMNIDGLSANTGQKATEIKNLAISCQNEHFDLAVNGIKLSDSDKNFTLEDFSISDLNFPDAINAMKNLNDLSSDPDKKMGETYMASVSKATFSLVPRFKNIHFSGLVVPPTNVNTDQENLPVKISSFDADADFTSGVIPTSLKISVKDIEVSAADWDQNFSQNTLSDAVEIQQNGGILEALGYDTIKADIMFDAAWNSEKEMIDVKEISLNYRDMANISIKGTLSNVDKALFSNNPVMITAAALAISAQNIDLSMNADDFLTRYEKLYDSTTEQKFSDERKQAAIKARLAIALTLGAENSQNMGEALQSFIQDGGTLVIHARAKSKQGIGLFDLFEAQTAPFSLLGKIDLSAQIQH